MARVGSDRPSRQVLLSMGALRAELFALVDAMDEKVKKHDEDIEKLKKDKGGEE